MGKCMIQVYEIGTFVLAGPEDDTFVVRVLGVAIYEEGVQYQVVWWEGREIKVEWVNESEVVSLRESEFQTVGFRKSPEE